MPCKLAKYHRRLATHKSGFQTLAGRRSPKGLTTRQQLPPLEHLVQIPQADSSQVLVALCSPSMCVSSNFIGRPVEVIVAQNQL